MFHSLLIAAAAMPTTGLFLPPCRNTTDADRSIAPTRGRADTPLIDSKPFASPEKSRKIFKRW
jgi:hypothetical protein